ncbi:MAG: phasin family protein [Proteobacteria bacterium]|jgi:phasin family protein|nr:phasin family protein [Pseudomonadota bacterium]
MFNKNSEQFSDAANKTVDAAYDFLQTSLESIEKLTKIQLNSSKKILDETSQTMKEISCANNPKDLFEKMNKVASNTAEHNASNCRDAYEVLATTQAQLGKMFETYFQNTQQSVAQAVENFSQFNPSKESFANDTFKNWFSSSNPAFDIFNKMASQATEFAANNMQSAATENNVKKPTSAKK